MSPMESILIIIKLLLLAAITTAQAETNGTCGFFGTTDENETLFLALLVLVAVLVLIQAIAFAIIAVKVLRALRRVRFVEYNRRSRSPSPKRSSTNNYSRAYPAERGVEMTEANAKRSSEGVYEDLNTRDGATYDNPTAAAASGTTNEPPRRKMSRFSKMPDYDKRNGDASPTVYENNAGWGRY